MNIKNLCSPNLMQMKKTSFKSTQLNDNSQQENVKFIAENIKSQKKDMKSIVNNGLQNGFAGAFLGICVQELCNLHNGYKGLRRVVENFNYSSVGFLVGGILAAGATFVAIVNKEEKK